MLPDRRFAGLSKDFWANVRAISEKGYQRGGSITVYSVDDMVRVMHERRLASSHIYDADTTTPTALGQLLVEYFAYRARVLMTVAEPNLMDVDLARVTYETLSKDLKPTIPTPMNKQKGDKRAPAYLTGIVNMLIEANLDGLPCDYSPRRLTLVSRNGRPLRTLSRRMDGAFATTVNPIAVWEVKEYYYTTTFGSRVADGVYESLLDGMELEELREHEGIHVQHLLIVDSHTTWWEDGRPFLCRLVDMLNMGYADEILFGREVVQRMPEIVKGWVDLYNRR